MPWKETDVNELRNKFIDAYKLNEWTMAALCSEFGISRKTGHKWAKRYDVGGRPALETKSSAPLHQANAMSPQMIKTLLDMRGEHPSWGPVKILDKLKILNPEQTWPAASSVGALLQRQGLNQTRQPRPRTPPYTQPLAHATAANDLWCVDFKGWFRTTDGLICNPLTVTDAYSRYILCIQGLYTIHGEGVIPYFKQIFRQYGMPLGIRSDNGSPFASSALAGLTRLSVWWLRLGIRHERIDPGHPEQNGRHERMHRTLKAEATQPPKANLRLQQLEFDRFRLYFDEERPHEAVKHRIPGTVYRASLGHRTADRPTGGGPEENCSGLILNPTAVGRREYPRKLPEWKYASDAEIRRVRSTGEIKWKNELVFVSRALIGERVRLQEIADGQYQLFLGPNLLAVRDRDNENWLPPTNRTPATGRKPRTKGNV